MAYEQATQVQCYSGRSHADRPTSFAWKNKQYEVKGIEKEWIEPGHKHFILIATSKVGEKSEKRFEICYDEREDLWWLCVPQ